ncbi:glycosyltransferase [candidate division KSB1 bacterium]|nr:glycosyltransferase [candidate division KSB1 bacterium]
MTAFCIRLLFLLLVGVLNTDNKISVFSLHNYYQNPGGEDTVFQNENKLLQLNGHPVQKVTLDNDVINHFSIFQKSKMLWESTWNRDSQSRLLSALKGDSPDICHIHNFFPLWSPSIFYYLKKLNIPTVITLHNYRFTCANAYLFRNDHICEKCVGKSTLRSVVYKCYQNSRIKSFAVSSMIEYHKKLLTWHKKVDAFICLTEFQKKILCRSGLPDSHCYIKPNFINDPNSSETYTGRSHFLFMGRFEHVKGAGLIMDALESVSFPISVLGVKSETIKTNIENVNFHGHVENHKVHQYLKTSIALIFPSRWYEGLPLSILEAFACSTPVIASNHGAMAELVEHGKTGLLFEPGNASDLAAKMTWAWEHKEEMRIMGENARRIYEEKYTPEKNYEMLMNIYEKAIENHHKNKK